MTMRAQTTQVYVITEDRPFAAEARDRLRARLGPAPTVIRARGIDQLPPTLGLFDLLIVDARCCPTSTWSPHRVPCEQILLPGPGPAAMRELDRGLERFARRMNLPGEEPSHPPTAESDSAAGSSNRPAQPTADREQRLLTLARRLATLKPEKIDEVCAEILPALIGARRVSAYRFNPACERLELVWKVPEDDRAIQVAVSPFRTDSPMALAVNRRRTWHPGHVGRELTAMGLALDRPHADRYQSAACIIAPVVYGAELLGVLNFADPVDDTVFNWTELEPLVEGIAHLLAVTWQNVSTVESLEQLARTDGLTGLANYRAFEETMGREVVRAQRYHLPLSLIIMDVDHLKQVNDRYGHQAGDLLLREVARRIAGAIRETDIAARQGGDEFSVILPNTPLAAVQQVVDRIEQAVNGAEVKWLKHVFQSSVSIAFGQYDGRSSVADFAAQVDARLYRRKPVAPAIV